MSRGNGGIEVRVEDLGGLAKTTGIVELDDGSTETIVSGRSEFNETLRGLPKGTLKGTGLNAYLRYHVEAQTAMFMRLNGADDATLCINRDFCGDSMRGCTRMFERYLSKGQTVTVYGPNGGTVIVGQGPIIPGIDADG